MNNSILITGGGTGGHIFPGISLYEEFKARGAFVSILIGKKDSFSPLSKIDRKDVFIYRAPGFTRNIFMLPFFVLSFFLAIIRAMLLIKKLKTDAMIGMGGYVSAPALIASVLFKIPVFLCEQNSIPGKVTTFFAGIAKKIFVTFPETEKYLKLNLKSRIVNAGNPIRKNVLIKTGREEARKFFHLGHSKKVILVIGGSQGAFQINELFSEVIKNYPDEFKDVGVIWITGNYSYKKIKDELGKKGGDGSIYLTPFIDDVGLAYKASDLAISRSGAGGIMEIAAVGLPSILIPYPHAADNHQEKNAEVFEAAGASIMMKRDEVNAENLGNTVFDLLSNQNQLNRMSEGAKSFAKVNAAKDIADSVIAVLGKGV